MFNLYLALGWFLAAITIFALQILNGEIIPLNFRIYGQPISIAWVMLLFGLFNLARHWAYKAARAEREAMYQMREERRRREDRDAPAEGGKEPDPNFVFDADPTPHHPRTLRERPPSEN